MHNEPLYSFILAASHELTNLCKVTMISKRNGSNVETQ